MKVSRIRLKNYMNLEVLVISPTLDKNTTQGKLAVWEINNDLRCKSVPYECYIDDIETLVIEFEENSDC